MERRHITVSVHEQGGLRGIDRQVEVSQGAVKLFVNGEPKLDRSLSKAQQGRVDELASRAAKVTDAVVPRAAGYLVSDNMATDISIDDGRERKTVQFNSGDSAPEEVFELLDAITGLARPD